MQTDHLKARLLEEKVTLEKELNRLGVKVAGGWEATERTAGDREGDLGENEAEEADQAEEIEEFEERTAEEHALEARYREVMTALEQIKKGSYGMCLQGGVAHAIEEGRLTANAAAATCVAHMQG